MRKLLVALTLTAASPFAHAACENEAINHIHNKYGLTAIDVKDLGGRGGQGGMRDREVWVKTQDGSAYSVFFFGGDCRFVSRDIPWGK